MYHLWRLLILPVVSSMFLICGFGSHTWGGDDSFYMKWRAGTINRVTDQYVWLNGQRFKVLNDGEVEELQRSSKIFLNPKKIFFNVRKIKFIARDGVILNYVILSHDDSSQSLEGH